MILLDKVEKNIAGRIFEIDFRQKLLNWIVFQKNIVIELRLSIWLDTLNCRRMQTYAQSKKLLHNDVRSNFFQFFFRNLMQMVNGSFEPVAQLRQFSLLWTNNKAKIRGFFLDDENRDFIKVNIKLHQTLAYFDPSSRALRPLCYSTSIVTFKCCTVSIILLTVNVQKLAII